MLGGAKIKSSQKIQPVSDFVLILAGMLVIFLYSPYSINGDGLARFNALTMLLSKFELSDTAYSLVGPLFSSPFWLIGNWVKSPEWWCARYNFFILVFGLSIFYILMRNHIECQVLSKFLLILLLASMFPHHQLNYYGEIFTAVLVGVGIASICYKHFVFGWVCLVLGVVNTPASGIGLVFVVLNLALRKKKWRYLVIILLAVCLVTMEAWLRRGNPFITGYQGNAGYPTVLPYSGNPGFSYPFFFGFISILLSFGKGIIFYAPGLLLWKEIGRLRISKELRQCFKLWMLFLIGTILAYSKWWAWYGGWYWGPRFFLIASIPGSMAIAIRIASGKASLLSDLAALLILAGSFWVGANGLVFGQHGLEICTANNYALESLCWYVPEFSPLLHPFVDSKQLFGKDVAVLFFFAICFIWLAAPLIICVFREVVRYTKEFLTYLYDLKKWEF